MSDVDASHDADDLHDVHDPDTTWGASPPLAWLNPGDEFPDVRCAWGHDSPAPGLLAAGGDLSVTTLRQAYRHGIFPWYSEGQPILWWSPDPRMVLSSSEFRLHPSLRKTLRQFRSHIRCDIQIDSAFEAVITHCAHASRKGQQGTWITSDMQQAYIQLHQSGHAHSVETWINGQLVGGLYCINIGRAVFGESMFTHVTDASKIALSALVALCRQQGIEYIDCQQNTRHLASLGARERPREEFSRWLQTATQEPTPEWVWRPNLWDFLV